MGKAFNMSMIMEEKWHINAADPEISEEEEAGLEDCSTVEPDLPTALNSCHRIRCAAHTLQLAVNGAIRGEQASKELLDVVNRVINMFRRSPLWTGRLKELCKRDLVPSTGTRWNSILAALKRLTQVNVFDAVEQLVQEYNDTTRTRPIDATSPVFTLPRLAELQGLLKPLGDATNKLQGDGFTSAIVHMIPVSPLFLNLLLPPAAAARNQELLFLFHRFGMLMTCMRFWTSLVQFRRMDSSLS
ncbi:hypothetical protein IscW_ISCW015007 [Ixodes scapularis]|uniref:Zinc finger BED domain-containing protein 4-like n=1 Tax=Ixodes scapularis TaxID=6945 RepID=B7QJT6_IXOSC|nr:hypothetical protein IscW_ISCW015007 [Ixodes scapularis]|eukprot:XP_002415443.1 hypothetical protein IscW_ISCW015007 [Ixodes scapularis]